MKEWKEWTRMIMAIVVLVTLVMMVFVPPNTVQTQAAMPDDQTLKSKFYFFEFKAPEPTMVVIYLVKNTSNTDVEVVYDLTSEVRIGGIGAIIDIDGPFGSKEPESYHWKKVPLAGGGDQYLIVTFPLPDGWTPGTKITPSVRLVPPPRG